MIVDPLTRLATAVGRSGKSPVPSTLITTVLGWGRVGVGGMGVAVGGIGVGSVGVKMLVNPQPKLTAARRMARKIKKRGDLCGMEPPVL